MSKIKIATDSTADIPKSFCEELNISVLPLTILADEKEYRDGVDISPVEFYKIIDASKKLPVSSQVSLILYGELFEETWKAGYTDLIQVTLNSKGSGTYQSAVLSRNLFYEEHPEAKEQFSIHIIDSKTYSMGYGIPVIEGAQLVKAGASVQEVIEHIEEWLEHSRPVFTTLDLRCVKKSGRINLFQDDFVDFMPVSLKILTDEKEYVDDEALDVSLMLADLKEYKGRSGTACPNMGDWMQAFGDAEEVYGVSLTSHLSGCYNAACIAAEEYMAEHPGRKVFILDSLSTGPELELLIEKYRELIELGYAFDEIQKRIMEYLKQTHLFFSLESLSNFAKNGRVSPTIAAAANLLGIRIVGRASNEGELEPLHKSRGEKRAMKQLWNCMQQSGYAGGKVRIRHSDNQNSAEILAGNIQNCFPSADIKIGVNRGLCSYYAEKGGILVGFEIK